MLLVLLLQSDRNMMIARRRHRGGPPRHVVVERRHHHHLARAEAEVRRNQAQQRLELGDLQREAEALEEDGGVQSALKGLHCVPVVLALVGSDHSAVGR